MSMRYVLANVCHAGITPGLGSIKVKEGAKIYRGGSKHMSGFSLQQRRVMLIALHRIGTIHNDER